MDIAYLQADLRWNRWLLYTINDKRVIEYTLDRIRRINCTKIVAGIYDCGENKILIEILKKIGGVQVILSEDEDVNSRFVNLMMNEEAEYIIRIGGDQIFLDVERVVTILNEMKIQGKEFFYHSGLSGVMPDIVSMDCLKIRLKNILREDRYFKALVKDMSVNRYIIPYPCTLLYDFRVNSNVSYRICKNIIEKKLDIYELSLNLSNVLRVKNNYLNRTGILGSWILGNTYGDFFRDENEMVNPWWGKSIIDLIIKKLDKNMDVFEWGSGNSTLFWGQYVGGVVSVESDLEWYEKMERVIGHTKNIRLEYCRLEYDGEYCRKILREEKEFDIILIDGRDRVRCAYHSIGKLKKNGIIIWDNSEREHYKEGYEFIKGHGFKQLELSSIIYGVPGIEDYTSIFYREDNILEL